MVEPAEAIEPSLRLAFLDHVLASVPVGVGVVDQDVRYVYVNDALAAMNGLPAADHLGRTVGEVLGDDLAVIALIRKVLESGEPVVGLETDAVPPNDPGVVHTYSTAFHPVWADGALLGVAGIIDDVTEQRRETDLLVQIIESIADGFYAVDHEWRFTFLNGAAESMFGRSLDDLRGRVIWEAFPESAGSEFERVYRRAMDRHEVVEVEGYSETLRRWVAVRAYPSAGGLSVYFRDVTAQRETDNERIRLERLREAAAERTARLGEFAAALTEVTAPADVARLVLVHAIGALGAHGGALALFGDTDHLEWMAIEGYDDDDAAAVAASPLGVERPLTRVVASRLPEFVSSQEELSAQFPDIAAMFLHLGDHALCSLPLIAGGRCLGGVTLTFPDPRPFSVEDRLLLAALTDLSAQALERARLFEREHRVAETLQRALLPERLARPERVRSAARYLPGTEGVAVGGDWFDVFDLDAQRLGIALGDVAGKGVGAAAVMGRLRNALRAFAVSIDSPATVLSRVDDFAARFGEDDLATVVYAVLDTSTGELRISSAGHLPPVVVTADGSTRLVVEDPDLPVGVAAGDERREHRVRLSAGDSIVLYSDGLVEDRIRSIDEGLAELQAAAAPLHAIDVEAACTALVHDLVGDAGGDDDVAVLVLRWEGPPAEDRCSVMLPAEVASARRARALLAEELSRWGQEGLVETGTLCVSEIVTNAVVHAGTPVRLDIALLPSCVRVEVHDGGAAPPERLQAQLDDVHGRGVAIVELLSSDWGVDAAEGGKCVWFELAR